MSNNNSSLDTVKVVFKTVWGEFVSAAGFITSFVALTSSAIALVNAVKPQELRGLSFTKSKEKPL